MGGQNQKLQLPVTPPLSDIRAILERTATQLAAHGVTGFFISFNFKIRAMNFHCAALSQDTALPPRDTIHAAAIELAQISDLITVTDQNNVLHQPLMFTAPTVEERHG